MSNAGRTDRSRRLWVGLTLVALLVASAVSWSWWQGRDARAAQGVSAPASAAATPTATDSESVVAVRDVHRVVALGDSVTSGANCDCTTFPDLIGQQLSALAGHEVSVRNDGVDGLTAAELLDQVRADRPTRSAISSADLVLVTIGANDLAAIEDETTSDCDSDCFVPKAEASAGEVGTVVTAIRQVNAHARVLVTNYWNVFEDGDTVENAAVQSFNNQVTTAFNSALQPAVTDAGATLVDLVAPFKGSVKGDPTNLLMDDGEHPNAAGHKAIADAVVTRIQAAAPPKA